MREIQNITIAIIKNLQNYVIHINNIHLEDLCKYLQKNKVSFVELKNRENEKWILSLFETEHFKRKIAEEEYLHSLWKKDFTKIKSKWDENKIDYMFHKSVGEFPYLSDNLDVLVRKKDFKKAGQLLKELKYVSLRNIQEEHKEFYRKFIGNYIVGPIHLHERVCWGVPYEDIDHLWGNRLKSSTDDLVDFPDYEDSILINTAHCFLEDHVIKLKDLLYIKKAIDSKSIDWFYIIKTSRDLHWEISLHTAFVIFHHIYMQLFKESLIPQEIVKQSESFINSKPWVNKTVHKLLSKEILLPFKIPHLWTRRHTALRELKDPSFGHKYERLCQVIGGLFDRFIHLKLKWHNQPGMLIAFTGIDGAGKTLHLNALKNAFENCDIKTKIVWTRVGSLTITKYFSRLYKWKGKNKFGKQSPKTQNLISKNKLIILFWRILNIIELTLYYFFSVMLPKLLSRVVICDRYYLDALVDFESYARTNKYDRLSYRIFKLLIPTPDITFYIDTSPELIIKRAKHNIYEDVQYNNLLLKKAVNYEKVIEINNNRDFDETSADLIYQALTLYFQRFPDKYFHYKVISYRFK